jgi:hypothetical protein
MKIIPAGKFESALARLVDEVVQPRRNTTGNSYYMDLNRLVDRSFVDGVGTFVALTEETVVPWELDWVNLNQVADERRIELGVHRSARRDRNDEEDNRRYDELRALNEQICKSHILSRRSLEYITSLDLAPYPEEVIKDWRKNIRKRRSEILSAYLRRLLNQIYTAGDIASSYLLIAEPDIQVLAAIGNALVERKLTTNLPFPDLRNRLLDPDTFAHGVLNFSPKDVRAVEHVRADHEVQQYANRIQGLLDQAPAGPDDPGITDALIDAYYRTKAGQKAKTVFEIATWVVKPLHYVPVAGEVLSVAEDIKDVAQKAAEIKLKREEWFLIGVRMQRLAIEQYLSRLSNNRHPALREYRDQDA